MMQRRSCREKILVESKFSRPRIAIWLREQLHVIYFIFNQLFIFGMSNTFMWLKNEKVLKDILQKVLLSLLPSPYPVPLLYPSGLNAGNRNHSGYFTTKGFNTRNWVLINCWVGGVGPKGAPLNYQSEGPTTETVIWRSGSYYCYCHPSTTAAWPTQEASD